MKSPLDRVPIGMAGGVLQKDPPTYKLREVRHAFVIFRVYTFVRVLFEVAAIMYTRRTANACQRAGYLKTTENWQKR